MKTKHTPLDRLKHHVTGAVERGEKQAIESVVSKTTKHTPGPWTIAGTFIQTPTGNPCAQIFRVPSVVENESNARLISAAPELLEALELILEYTFDRINPSDLIPTIARKAINKARGES